jgi:ClpX C4-type zinc finger protein
MPDRRGPTRCSFCGKTEQQVRSIVSGPGVYICDGCVYLCVEVLNEEHIPNEAPKADQISALQAEIRRLHGLLRLESQLVKDLRVESEQLKARPKTKPRSRLTS